MQPLQPIGELGGIEDGFFRLAVVAEIDSEKLLARCQVLARGILVLRDRGGFSEPGLPKENETRLVLDLFERNDMWEQEATVGALGVEQVTFVIDNDGLATRTPEARPWIF